jgi:hypothetical protein
MSFGNLVAVTMRVVVVRRVLMWRSFGGSFAHGRKAGVLFKLLDTSSMHGS